MAPVRLKGTKNTPRPAASSNSWLRVSLLCAAAAALVAYLGTATAKVGKAEAPDANSTVIVSVPVWETLPGARPVFGAEIADHASLSRAHEARRHREGGREDGLAIGSAEAATFARVDIARGAVGSEPGNLFVAAVRRAAASGASVMRVGQSLAVETKFGSVEAAPAILSTGSERACLAFQFGHGELAFKLNGFLCSAPERATTAQELACFIDSIAYLGGTEDPALKVLFAQTDKRKGPGCGHAVRTVAARKP